MFNAAIDLLLYVGSTRHYHLQYNGKVEVPDGLEHARPLIESNDGFLAPVSLLTSLYLDAS